MEYTVPTKQATVDLLGLGMLALQVTTRVATTKFRFHLNKPVALIYMTTVVPD